MIAGVNYKCVLPVRKNSLFTWGGNLNPPECKAKHWTWTSREGGWTKECNYTYITYHLQSNWNTRKENWYKLKELYRRRKHKCQQRCQLRVNIFPIKSRHLILTSPWQLSKSYNRENNNLLLFLEPHQISLLICPTRAEIKLDAGTKLKRSCGD